VQTRLLAASCAGLEGKKAVWKKVQVLEEARAGDSDEEDAGRVAGKETGGVAIDGLAHVWKSEAMVEEASGRCLAPSAGISIRDIAMSSGRQAVVKGF